jgi:predicted ArsR family transcriptional regulator
VPERTARRSLGRLTRAGVLREGRESSGGMGAPRKVWEVVS